MKKTLTSNELRDLFINYFKDKQHKIIPSSSLVPTNDPTLLFTNAGMVQFKEIFLGNEKPPKSRAISVQRCVRAGGKHNDLENVGYTKRHHTFFEMLGNFSFGDYFKHDAILFAWTFLTEVLGIPQDRLWVTVYKDDKESEAIWLNEMKVDPKRFSRCGEKDNFWSMGETGPCGPCTEIFYDHGPEVDGGPPGSADDDSDRYVEIWNLVFMQYNRSISGELSPLPKPCVDTGMGLERIAAVMQGVHDNYDIDIFQRLMSAIAGIIGCDNFADKSMRVIADHTRSSCFLIADGVMPSNEGRGYVLRRIIRRAIRHGFKLGHSEPFFYKLVPSVVEIMGGAHPGLVSSQTMIEAMIKKEEVQFAKTLDKGLKILDQAVSTLDGGEIPGDVVFQLYDTYGFPPDLTADIARERKLTLDYPEFERAMQAQRERSKEGSHFMADQTHQLHIAGETEFTGYETLMGEGTVTTLLKNQSPVEGLNAGDEGAVVLDRTPFYAESGGQVGDSGYLTVENGRFRVKDTKKIGKVYLHFGEMIKGTLEVGVAVRAEVDASRQDIILNHSATHLLHEALRRVLGEHVVQKGSLVEAARLRFDFSHPQPVTDEQLQAVEHLVNQQIRANVASTVTESSLEDAKATGALALFGEKYADTVRVVKMGDFSTEVCGGTHAARSGDIGLFKITSESGTASGVRRIEAVTGAKALQWVETNEQALNALSALLKTGRDTVTEKVMQLLEQNRDLNKRVSQMKQAVANQQSGSLADQAIDIEGIKVLAVEIADADRDTMRNTIDQLKQQLGSAAILLASIKDNKIQIVAGVTKSCLEYFKAGDLLNQVAQQVGGKGGGRPDFAQGGGEHPDKLPAALTSVPEWVKQQLS